VFLQLDGKLMEKIAITVQSLKMLNTQESWGPKLQTPREASALSHCIIHMTRFSSGMVFTLSVYSQSCSATLLWEFYLVKFFIAFHYNSFSTFFFLQTEAMNMWDMFWTCDQGTWMHDQTRAFIQAFAGIAC